ncbi:hypothetical protein ACFVFS_38545 [Kitasatospora sp. NPDC057692]|uniref:hypothetical protein n=1 Tax=Kitasatospora sp. NPDC057692 TaxID=3346215 RepID=UPI0036AD0EE4
MITALAAVPVGVAPRALDRLAAHLRRTGTVLLTPGPWPGAQLRLEVTASRWGGLGDGWGKLTGRRARVTVTGRGSAARSRSAELWLPAADGTVTAAAPDAAALAEGPASGPDRAAAFG